MTSKPKISAETIRWAYRLFLDRDPENDAAIANKLSLKSYQELRSAFVGAEEFKRMNSRSIALDGNEPPIRVDEITDDAELKKLLEHIGTVWKQLGVTEPHWSVLTEEQFKQENLAETKTAFYNSGKANVNCLLNTLKRNEIDISNYRSCLEYGCGVGRLTRWLGEYFETVHGYDISKPHLDSAQAYLTESGLNNVMLHQVQTVDDLRRFPMVDVIYTLIVLQHNPPPIIVLILEGLMQSLNPGGVALFQVPTYQAGYEFTLKSYLNGEAKQKRMELHFLPQRKVFDIVHRGGGRVIEVLEDGWIGANYKELSNTFLIQKES